MMGDHNTLLEKELLFEYMENNQFQSALFSVHKTHPEKTWSTGIESTFKDIDGLDCGQRCLDYIWYKGDE